MVSNGEHRISPTSVEISPSLTPTSPYSRASVTRHERWTLFVKIYAANPASFTRKDKLEYCITIDHKSVYHDNR